MRREGGVVATRLISVAISPLQNTRIKRPSKGVYICGECGGPNKH